MSVVEALVLVIANGGLLALWQVRTRARQAHQVRLRQLEEAAALLSIHVTVLDRFLADASAPESLKRLLVQCSDAMGERAIVTRIAEWIASRPIDVKQADDPAFGEILAQLAVLRPDLVDDFHQATWTVVAGSVLRWPESAVLLEQIVARNTAGSRADAGLAAAAASYQRHDQYGLSLRPHAMAA